MNERDESKHIGQIRRTITTIGVELGQFYIS